MKQKDRSNPEKVVEVGATAVPTAAPGQDHVRVTLTGSLAGRTCVLNRRYNFVAGSMPLPGSLKENAKTLEFLRRFYGVAVEEVTHGKRGSQADAANPRGGAPVVGDAQPGGGGAPAPAAAGGGVAAAAPAAPEAVRLEPDRDGHGGGGAPPAQPPKVTDEKAAKVEAEKAKLRDAVYALDPDDAEAWTPGGRPGLNYLEKAVGFRITRERVDAVAPDWDRMKAKAKRQEGLPRD